MQKIRSLRCLLITILALTSANLAALAKEPPAASNQPARVEAILDRLEARGQGLKDLRTKVIFVENDRVNLTTRVKTGEILFWVTEPNPRFLVTFYKTEIDGVVGKREWYLFDGRWLYEGIERLEQVTQREFAEPGERIDFFDLETAPFPLPFGQKKESILRNFSVTLAEPAATDPANTDHLICIPKPDGAFYRKYDQLEFFVQREVDLPVRIVVTKNDRMEINTAEFPGLTRKSINSGVDEDDLEQPKEWKKYKRVVEGPGPSVERPGQKP